MATLSPQPGSASPSSFSDGWLADAIANVMLFVPFGAALQAVRTPRPLVLAGLALLLAVAIEGAQGAGWVAGRDASVRDVATNLIGAIAGAAIVRNRRWLAAPNVRRATALALGWCAVAITTLTATAWALGFPAHAHDGGWQRSDLEVTPGFGWFAGTVSATHVNGLPFEHAGTGPVIVQMPRSERRINAQQRGRGADRRAHPVPFLFVHAPREREPSLLVGTLGDGIVVRSTRRASAFGLHSPQLQVRSVWPDASGADSLAWSVDARATGAQLEARIRLGDSERRGVLLLVPTLGWALVQNRFDASAPYAAALTALWLAILIAPVGYWGWWSDERRATVLLLAGSAFATIFYLLPRSAGVALVPAWQWWTLAVALTGGLLLGRITMSHHDAPQRHHDRERDV